MWPLGLVQSKGELSSHKRDPSVKRKMTTRLWLVPMFKWQPRTTWKVSCRRLQEGRSMRVRCWCHGLTSCGILFDWLCPSTEGPCCCPGIPKHESLSFWILETQPSRPRGGNSSLVTSLRITHCLSWIPMPTLTLEIVYLLPSSHYLNLSGHLCFAGTLTLP